MQLKGTSGKIYTTAKELKPGGEGMVYTLQGAGNLLAKVYFPEKRTPERREKIRAMVTAQVHKSAPQIAFPIDGLLDSKGEFVGFVMEMVENAREIHQLYDRRDRAQFFPDAGVRHLVRTASNLARIFEDLHANQCVVGDISEANILVKRDATVCLIDSDSMQFHHQGKTHVCSVGTPLYMAPELIGVSGSKIGTRIATQDCFGMAVILFRLIMNGAYPFAGTWTRGGTPPNSEERMKQHLYAYGSQGPAMGLRPQVKTMDIGWLSQDIRVAFEGAFGRSGRTSRPTASQWVKLLDTFEDGLAKCPRSSFHEYHPGMTTDCPWCALEHVRGEPMFGKNVWKPSPPPPPPPPPPPSPPRPTPMPAPRPTPTPRPVQPKDDSPAPWFWALGAIAVLAVIGLVTSNSGKEQAAQATEQNAEAEAMAQAAANAASEAAEARRHAQEAARVEQERQMRLAAEREERLSRSVSPTREIQRISFVSTFSPESYRQIVLLTDVGLEWEQGIYEGQKVTFDRIREHEFRISEPDYGRPSYNIYLKGPARSGIGEYFRDIDCRDDRANCQQFYEAMLAAMDAWRREYGDLYQKS